MLRSSGTRHKNVVNASIRMMRLPASAANANASTPGIPFSTAPPTAANPLQVPRSQLKTNPIRAALKTEVQGGKPPGSSGKTPGAYMAPHSTPYQVMSAATEEGQRSRGVPPVSVSPVPMQGYLSATKATSRQQQLIRESARETFAKTYTYQKSDRCPPVRLLACGQHSPPLLLALRTWRSG